MVSLAGGLKMVLREMDNNSREFYPFYGIFLASYKEIGAFRYNRRLMDFLAELDNITAESCRVYVFYKSYSSILDFRNILNRNYKINIEDLIVRSSNESYATCRLLKIGTKFLPGIVFFDDFHSRKYYYFPLNGKIDTWIFDIRSLFDCLFNRSTDVIRTSKEISRVYSQAKGRGKVLEYRLSLLNLDENDFKETYNNIHAIYSRQNQIKKEIKIYLKEIRKI
jgi:hypothetical protein